MSDARGFTLVEVLVSLLILAFPLTALLGMIGDGVRRADDTQAAATAGALAQSLLAAAGRDGSLGEGERSGTAPGGFRWQVRIAAHGSPEDQNAWPMAAYRVQVDVGWRAQGQERRLGLATLRLAAKPEAP